METKPISHITAGLSVAALIIILTIVFTAVGAGAGNQTAGPLTYLVVIAGLAFFVNRYGRSQQYTASFGNLFSFGFKSTAVITVVFVSFTIIFNLLYPEFGEKALEATRVQLEKQGQLSDTDIDAAVSMTKKYFWPFIIGSTVLGFAIIGAIGSLIGAAITKKRPHDPFQQTAV